ncbi:MAG: hypothetical protein ACYDA8_17240 [Deferrisomatales bacterium]
MSKPAGLLIRRWFVLLVALLLGVDLMALAGSLAISRSVRVVVEEAEPLALASASVRHAILGAQKELFRYLAEFSDDPRASLAHLDQLNLHLAQARAVAGSPEVAAELAAIEHSAEQYRKVIETFPAPAEGSRDWSRLQEYSATAVRLGGAVEDRATQLVEAAQAEIRRRATEAERVASWARWAAVGILTASVLVVAALLHWWRRFQELMLGI